MDDLIYEVGRKNNMKMCFTGTVSVDVEWTELAKDLLNCVSKVKLSDKDCNMQFQ
jgi:hypothetical protein